MQPKSDCCKAENYAFPVFSKCFAYRCLNFSIRPAVSISFCLPVKKGWQAEQISTLISVMTEPRSTSFPQAHNAFMWLYFGCISFFIRSIPPAHLQSGVQFDVDIGFESQTLCRSEQKPLIITRQLNISTKNNTFSRWIRCITAARMIALKANRRMS